MTLGISIPPILGHARQEDPLAGLPPAPRPPAVLPRNASLLDETVSLARYMAQTEVHTYAFSVAANTILSLFPFIVMMFTIARLVFHSHAMESAIADMIRYFLPTGQEFVTKNMEIVANARKGVQLASVVMLLISSTGVFLPLEVALNRVWGVTKNRSYVMNQMVSLGLAAGIGTLAMMSVAVTAAQKSVLQFLFFGHTDNVAVCLCQSLAAADFGRHGQYPALLSHLLDSSQPQAACPGGAADRDCDWALLGAGKDAVRRGAALDGPSFGIRPLFCLGEPDVVGLHDRPAAAGRSALLGLASHFASGLPGRFGTGQRRRERASEPGRP